MATELAGPPRGESVTVGDIEVHYRSHGPIDGDAVVFRSR